mgnify:CR=1 FL=1
MVSIILKDGKKVDFEKAVPLFEAAKAISNSLGRDAVVAKVNGEYADLRDNIEDGTQVEFFTKDSPEALHTLRHTAAHVMAQAIQHLFPGTKFAIGPAIDTGFYYDLESEHKFTNEDFPAIEKEMAKIVKENLAIQKSSMSREEALAYFRERDQDYKVELIEQKTAWNLLLKDRKMHRLHSTHRGISLTSVEALMYAPQARLRHSSSCL